MTLRQGRPITLGVALALGILIVSAPVAGASGLSSGPGPSPIPYASAQWSNGDVLCTFDPSQPSVTVTANGSLAQGIWLGMGEVRQESLLGVVRSSAMLTTADWSVANVSSPSQYSLRYSANVPVLSTIAATLGIELGTVAVNATFSLELDSNATDAPSTYEVAVALSLAHWPWAPLSTGSLAANFTLAPASASVGYLKEGAGANSSIGAVNNSSGATLAYLAMGAQANITNATGITAAVPVTPTLLAMTGETATMEVDFSSSASHARAVNYTADVIVTPPSIVSAVASIPPPLLAGGIVAGAVVSLAVAGVTRRLRRTPSDLEYVKEDP